MNQQVIQFVGSGRQSNSSEVMTSLEVASVCGKPHSDILKAIRKMEPAWEKVAQGKFSLGTYKDANGQERPCYNLSKRETLFVATKFKDEERAKLILRWEELEMERQQPKQLSPVEMFALQAQINLQNEQRLSTIEQNLSELMQERKQNQQLLLSAELSDKELPEESENSKIRSLVNAYVKATGVDYKTAWESIYNTLESRYKKRIKAYVKLKSDKSYLDVAIRNGLGEYLYVIISNMIKNINN